jgi:uridine phosphorylase
MSFQPRHINATADDLAGNNGIGRYIFLPGSDGRAKEIAQHFDDLTHLPHSRGHHFYKGTITAHGKKIDVATVASGMGCPSMEIILHELFQLGGKRFLRIGTAGSLQSNLVKLGDLVSAQASVRDEQTTADYVPVGMPAIASNEMLTAISQSATKLKLDHQLHTGVVHCKSSFYAREFGAGPQADNNNAYIDLLTRSGVLATEMETAALFVQAQLYNYQLMLRGTGPQYRVLVGAILGIVAVPPHDFASAEKEVTTIKDSIELAMETIKSIWSTDMSWPK